MAMLFLLQPALHYKFMSCRQRQLFAQRRKRFAPEFELVDVVDTLERVVSIIERGMAKEEDQHSQQVQFYCTSFCSGGCHSFFVFRQAEVGGVGSVPAGKR